MIAAIYARKSTEQNGVADEQKSVTRQAEHARAYAARNGWAVDEACVYVDDGISGAEFANRPGFLRLMNALKPRAPFQALVMSEVSRLGREQIETAYALKQLSVAGVRCFSLVASVSSGTSASTMRNARSTVAADCSAAIACNASARQNAAVADDAAPSTRRALAMATASPRSDAST